MAGVSSTDGRTSAVSDGAQSLTLGGFRQMMADLKPYIRLWEAARAAAAQTVA